MKAKIINEIQRKGNMIQYLVRLDNGINAKLTCFDLELDITKDIEIEKNSKGFWQFVKYSETNNIIENKEVNLIDGDEYLTKQEDKFSFGMAINIAFERNKNRVIDNLDKDIDKEIENIYNIIKRNRNKILKY